METQPTVPLIDNSAVPLTSISNTQDVGNGDERLQSPVVQNSEKPFKDVENSTEEFKHQCIPVAIQKYAGMIFTLIASFLFSGAVLIVKILSGPEYDFHSYSASFWRYLGITLPAIPLVLIVEARHRAAKRESVFATIWPLGGFREDSEKWFTILGIVTRGFLGASTVILRYYALEFLSIADTSVITYATPVLVTVMAHFFLGEKMGIVPVLAAILTVGGVIIMTRPPFLTGETSYDTNNLIGIGLASGSLLCASLIVIITRKIRNVHFSVLTLGFGFIGLLLAFSLAQGFGVFKFPTESAAEFLLVAGLMIITFLGQMAIVLGLILEQAGPVSLIRSCDVIFGFIFQFIFLGVVPDELSAIGGITVLACIIAIGIRKWIATLPADSETRRKYRFMLK